MHRPRRLPVEMAGRRLYLFAPPVTEWSLGCRETTALQPIGHLARGTGDIAVGENGGHIAPLSPDIHSREGYLWRSIRRKSREPRDHSECQNTL